MRVAFTLLFFLLLLLSPVAAGAPFAVAAVVEYEWTNPLTVAFTAYSDCEDCVFRWDMGDGTVLAGRTVNHSFALQGLWAPHRVELLACTPSGSVCETRFVPVVLVHWPAILGLVAALFGIAVLGGKRRIRIRVLEVAR